MTTLTLVAAALLVSRGRGRVVRVPPRLETPPPAADLGDLGDLGDFGDDSGDDCGDPTG